MYPKKYPKSMIMIHWLTLILFVAVFYVGTTLEDFEFNEQNMNRYRLHAFLGISIAFLTLIRIFVRRHNLDNLPPHISFYSSFHKTFYTIVHYLIYIFLIFTPMVGFVMVYQTGALSYDLGGPFPTGAEFDENLEIIHKISVFTLLSLIVIHIAGVIIYKIKSGDNLLTRMLP